MAPDDKLLRARPRTWLLLAGMMALCLLLPAAARAQQAPGKGKVTAKARPTVAILYFNYTGQSAELRPLRKGLARMLISDLSVIDAFQIVERERLEAVLAELKLGRSKRFDSATAAKVGKLLGARYFVMGGFFDYRGTIRIDARVVEVETGKVLRGLGAKRPEAEFLELEQQLAQDLGAILTGAVQAAPPRHGKGQPVRRRPRAPKRLRAKLAARYGKALDAKDRGDLKSARAELKAVVKAQPDFALAAVDLAALAK